LNSLEQLDIPHFEVSVESATDVETGSAGITRGILADASYPAVIEDIQNLSESDLRQQVGILRGAFAARAMEVRRTGEPKFPQRYPSANLSAEQFVEEARRIAVELDQHAIFDNRQGAQWIGLESMREINRYRLQPLGSSPYDGLSGVS